MTGEENTSSVQIGFEPVGVRVAIADLLPLRLISRTVKGSAKYAQIASSIREVGLVEPPLVARDRDRTGKFLLLDGHLRVEVLKNLGVREVDCLVSADDEAFTYNKWVNRITIVQEHRMILEAIRRGVPEERIAKALNVNIKSIQAKKRLLTGICPEAVELLKDRSVPFNTFAQLKKMSPLRQIEAAELMVAMSRFTVPYAKSLLAATPQSQLARKKSRKKVRGLSTRQMALMEKESANLDREFKLARQSYASDHLDLVLARGYLAKLLGNAEIVRYLGQHYADILDEFRKLNNVTV